MPFFLPQMRLLPVDTLIDNYYWVALWNGGIQFISVALVRRYNTLKDYVLG